jgi:hypothetical protein
MIDARRRPLVFALLAWALFVAPASAVVIAARVTVTTSPTIISQNSSDVGPLLIKNKGAASVFLGGASVTPETGYELEAAEAVSITLGSNEAIYGIVASGTVVLHKLENRK